MEEYSMIYQLYDTEGYWTAAFDAEEQPENSTLIEPELQDGYWSRFDGTQWLNEKVPDTVEDIIGLSVPALPASMEEEDKATQHESVIRAIIENILSTTEDAKAVIADGVLTVVAVSKEEQEAEKKAALFAQLREARDAKLAATDFYLAADYPIEADKLEAVKTYRQALRDLPEQNGAPWDGGGEATPWPTLEI